MSLLNRQVDVKEFRFNCYFKPPSDNEGVFVMHHGIGSSSQTFYLLAEALSKLNPKLGILTYDARFHGQTRPTTKNSAFDLSLDSLVDDLNQLLPHFVQPNEKLAMLGHSMGSTVVCKAVNTLKYNFIGVVVIEAVEGYARQALSSMHSLLALWPKQFKSIDEAVKWHLRNQLRNKGSAEHSVPAVLKRVDDHYEWILNLEMTSPFWDSWFQNLDELFLSAKCARLLVLAGTGRLDTAFTRAQMQGKFQIAVYSEAGHYIQEDVPDKVAQLLTSFWDRNANPLQFVPKFGKIRLD